MQLTLRVTITDHTKFFSLYDMLTGAGGAGYTASFAYDGGSAAGHGPLPPGLACQEVTIQADPANGATMVLVGDANISATHFGAKLAAGDAKTKRSGSNSLSLKTMKFGVDVDGGYINFEVEFQ